MPEPRPILATAAQIARILGLSRSRITQLRHAEGCPFVETPGGDRYDVAETVAWYMARRGTASAKSENEGPPVDDTEGMRRMTRVVHQAIQEHVSALTTDHGLRRFNEILKALGVDERTRYFARRTLQLWLGTTLPSGEIAVAMEDPLEGPPEGPPVQWEAEWRDTVGKNISGSRPRG